MNIYARQGDLVISKLADGALDAANLVARENISLAGDSSGHRHRVVGPALVEATAARERTKFRVSAATTLVHEKQDGHADVALAAGDYEILPLRERGGAGDRSVED